MTLRLIQGVAMYAGLGIDYTGSGNVRWIRYRLYRKIESLD